MDEVIRTVVFDKDYSKLEQEEFGTLRLEDNKKPSKYSKDSIYLIKTPTKEFKARCVVILAEYLYKIVDKFLIEDTDTNSRTEAIAVLKQFYPDLHDESTLTAVFFEKV